MWDARTGEFVTDSAQFLVLKNARPMVHVGKYMEAKKSDFKNSGDPLDYFAWLECDSFELKREPEVFHRLTDVLCYNPFKHHLFRDRATGNTFLSAYRFPYIFIEGNQLRYIRAKRKSGLIKSRLMV